MDLLLTILIILAVASLAYWLGSSQGKYDERKRVLRYLRGVEGIREDAHTTYSEVIADIQKLFALDSKGGR